MISKIERGEANATAIVLGKLSAAFGQTLSTLLAGVDKKADRHSKRAEQSVWKDSQTGYVRRALSPPNDGPLQLTEILLPAGARVNYPAAAYSFIHQQVWLIKGKLVVEMGEEQYRLQAGDCLEFGPPADTSFANESDENCRYLVAILVR
jgi:transcriptional regulator with XRE-family HTH domain